MFHVTCESAASQLFTNCELLALLEETRATNTRLGITGMLLYEGGNFLQVLEGEQEAVMRLVAMIKADRRHKRFNVLLSETSERRLFPDWSIGFRDLRDSTLVGRPGFSQFLNTPFTGVEFSADPPRCMKLLLSFKKNM
jgi:hypothetical protein